MKKWLSHHWLLRYCSWFFLSNMSPDKVPRLQLTLATYYFNCQEVVTLSPWVSCVVASPDTCESGLENKGGADDFGRRSWPEVGEGVDPVVLLQPTTDSAKWGQPGHFLKGLLCMFPLQATTTLTTKGYNCGCLPISWNVAKNERWHHNYSVL